jgi:hypothetical protein
MDGTGSSMEYTFTRIEVNVPISDVLFELR